jgi:carboxyl-terminal processing protease
MKLLKTSLLFAFIIKLQTISFAQENTQLQIEKFATLINIIEFAYVDSVNQEKLVEDAINGMLEKLDPHSVYIPKKDLQEMNEPLEGNFEGIGIQFNILRDTIVVMNTISGGPSEKLGIMSGDKIVVIDGKTVAGIKIKNDDVLKLLRGKKGTKVNVGILKSGTKKIIEYTIVRDKIPIYSVDAAYMIDNSIGYIKVNRFAQTTMDELLKAMKSLKEKGMKDLILDLNDNGGGFLHIAIEMADEFLNDKKLIVYTEGLSSPKQMNMASQKGNFEKGRLVVLVDEGSASASEIVSGAIQDWDRGLLIGRRTFGKGLVQKPYQLPDGSMIRLTTARYYTPVGRSIQKPYKEGVEKYHEDLVQRYKKGELMNADSIHFPDSLRYTTPKGRFVYGGGGVMPDIFIPLDTSMNSELVFNIARKNVWGQYILNLLDKERGKLLSKYPTFESFKKGFSIDENFMNNFFVFAEKEGVKKNEKEYETSKKLIQTRLKADLARNLYNTDAFFEIINELEPSYLKAIDVLKDGSYEKFKLSEN